MDLYSELTAKYQTIPAIATEIINLEAILNLPKPTEAFMSDIHGEYNAFQHVLRNGSGNVKSKIRSCFRDEMTEKTLQRFAFLVYYPSERLAAIHQEMDGDDLQQWYLTTFRRLIRLLAFTATKYTRSKVRKAMAPEFVYITEELLYNDASMQDKLAYYWQIIHNLIVLEQADEWIEATCRTIQRLTVDHFHIVGDIYDRGPAPDQVVESLIRRDQRHSVDIQWGNHDILWIGGAAGSALCIANLVRISARYNNLSILEDVYGINLRHLARLAEQYYQDNPAFSPKLGRSDRPITEAERLQITQIHQAIAMIQFKLEGPTIKRRPEFEMDHRLLLDKLAPDFATIELNGHTYPIENGCFATVDPADPYRLLPEEKEVIDSLVESFTHSEKLHRHMDFLINRGSMYLRYNRNLLLHGCVPVDEDGNFIGLTIDGTTYAGRQLFDMLEANLRLAYSQPNEKADLATDLLWYLWTGPNSPLFGKHDMTTFERYFINDPATHVEGRNPYYQLRKDPDFIKKILEEFVLDPEVGHVINGHTPVKKGTDPIMANNKMIVIDGGFSKPYQKTTGIGGYTLLDNSYGMQLVTHQPFTTKADAIANLTDIISTRRVVETEARRRTVAETDIGTALQAEVEVLKRRLAELRNGD
ncbi:MULTISPECIES: fructose-1,6-bisphosphatase [Lacticaseibacillus]|uniref:Fructose-1,6-bisphosphatase class 3 n=1 Tax=Lacticaseibacillus zeae subsp. silagei TaxID=3068307 RepID=A0ABD7Z6L2_LACZE|nr:MULTISPECIES: fructose-1,6-bisphosphatase [Lacticaseibacillus]OFR91539.1 fructose 1,6-bisphosphatase [Lactobacillus sp. HMSC068F07]MDE3282993.1 fructose-1,6-bisphosphatase [Lacticaseibacillus casei]MDE3315708.1 fructose-1,6-bisphosphatase [Lacticaseibacillus zeae]WLV82765.1 fructose-1,6-bisphosphatase [Lacticaseibacillus sp. NCIMB 15475]WLV85506.1 fructose-1,6-bisphosphatase [Lacticaseibacillus sp. NCIMB 15474]